MASIILGICGSISAYKTPELVRLFKKAGVDVRCMLTASALHFVSPLSLETVSEHPVVTPDTFFSGVASHLAYERVSDVFVMAPATANCIAKCAHGICDDPVTTSFLAFQGPRIIAPAMHTEMWENPITQDNVRRLQAQGVLIVGPDTGALACGDTGVGRLVDLSLIVHAVKAVMVGTKPLGSKRILITLGGTKEKMDNMRVITNLSTGRLGWHLATTASLFGAQVGVIATVDAPMQPPHLSFVDRVESVAEMQDALLKRVPDVDVVYMVAAVSDFTLPPSDHKLKRDGDLTLTLQKTPDLLRSIAPMKGDKTYIGFCLDDHDLLAVAKKKLDAKHLDYIVANTSSAVGASTRKVHILSRQSSEITTLTEVGLPELSLALLGLS